MNEKTNDRGASLVEYALLIALCVLIAVVAIHALGVGVNAAYLSHCAGHAAPNGDCTLK